MTLHSSESPFIIPLSSVFPPLGPPPLLFLFSCRQLLEVKDEIDVVHLPAGDTGSVWALFGSYIWLTVNHICDSAPRCAPSGAPTLFLHQHFLKEPARATEFAAQSSTRHGGPRESH